MLFLASLSAILLGLTPLSNTASAAAGPRLALSRGSRTTSPAATLSLSRPTRTPTSSPSCNCGYSKLGAHFPKVFNIDFTKTNTPSAISKAGMYITSTFDYQIGAVALDGTTAYGQASNIRPAKDPKDGVELVVPGAQKGKKVTGAEMAFQAGGDGMTRIFAEVEMRIDPTPGTCQSMFTYVQDYEKFSDELDIEILGSSIMKASDVADPGVQLTNFNPDQSGESDHRIIPFTTDPTKGFNKFSIAWANGKVEYAMNGKVWRGPTKFVAVNPSNIIINHWATGDHGFFGASMPSKDVVLKVRNLKVYYATQSDKAGFPAGCTQSDVCQL